MNEKLYRLDTHGMPNNPKLEALQGLINDRLMDEAKVKHASLSETDKNVTYDTLVHEAIALKLRYIMKHQSQTGPMTLNQLIDRIFAPVTANLLKEVYAYWFEEADLTLQIKGTEKEIKLSYESPALHADEMAPSSADTKPQSSANSDASNASKAPTDSSSDDSTSSNSADK